MKKRTIALIMATTICLGSAIGGTLAWLTDKTIAVENTFTTSDVDIDLTETFNVDSNEDGILDSWQKKMVPGSTIPKDPKVTVNAISEACYLFVKLEESENFDTFLTYEMAGGWTQLPGETDVYYREVGDLNSDQPFSVLKNDQVMVKDTVEKKDMNALTAATYPKLTITAYAVQKENVADVVTAWSYVPKN